MNEGRPRSKSFLPILVVVAAWGLAVYGASRVDDPLMTWLNGPGPSGMRSNRDWARPFFEGVLDSAVFISVIGILFSFPNRRRLLASWLGTILLSALLTRIMKITIGRARPSVEAGPEAFDPMSFVSSMHSFPSGHSSSAVTMALLLGLYFPRGRAVFWFLAAIVGLERIRGNAHFLSDVVAGAGIGALAVYLSYRALGERFFSLDAVHDRPVAN